MKVLFDTSVLVAAMVSAHPAHDRAVLWLRKAKAGHAADYLVLLRRLVELEVAGGAVYDGLIARVADKVGADRLLTLNLNHFRRVWPEGSAIISSP